VCPQCRSRLTHSVRMCVCVCVNVHDLHMHRLILLASALKGCDPPRPAGITRGASKHNARYQGSKHKLPLSLPPPPPSPPLCGRPNISYYTLSLPPSLRVAQERRAAGAMLCLWFHQWAVMSETCWWFLFNLPSLESQVAKSSSLLLLPGPPRSALSADSMRRGTIQ
jgi:hypothetical protein